LKPEKRTFLDAHSIEAPLEWAEAPRARIVSTPEPAVEAMEVTESQLQTATTQVIVLVFCAKCGRRHAEPELSFQAGELYVCRRCGTANRRPHAP
jgi:DNA-directed RNA polymerase subunit RPC12/RpoP